MIQQQVGSVKVKTAQLEKAFRLVENDNDQYDYDSEELQTMVENVKTLKENTIRLKGWKEGAEKQNLAAYL